MIKREDRGRVRVLRFDHPPANTLTLGLLERFREELRTAKDDTDVGVLIIASALPKYFSTGIDLEELIGLEEDKRSEPFLSLIETFRLLEVFPKPTVACINGSAILGGWILAMACDFRLLGREQGRIALSEIRLGLSPTRALIQKLSSIGHDPNLVKQMVLMGRTLRAEEALAGGFVDEVLPGHALLDEALKDARALLKLSPRAYASIKKSLGRVYGEDPETLWKESLKDFKQMFADPQTLEGLKAMKEKRRPRWENQGNVR